MSAANIQLSPIRPISAIATEVRLDFAFDISRQLNPLKLSIDVEQRGAIHGLLLSDCLSTCLGVLDCPIRNRNRMVGDVGRTMARSRGTR